MLKRLLFVNDEGAIRETLAIILRRYRFTVTLASKVDEALEEIETQEFDLLLCDLNIERERDGFGVVGAMRKVRPHCVTVVLTELGIDDYVTKPANADTLVALLAEKLAARKAKILKSNFAASFDSAA